MSARPWLSFLTGKRCQLNFWAPHQTCSARVSIVLATRSTGRHSVTGRCPAGPATDGSCGFQLSKHPYNKCASKPWRRHLQGCPVRSRTSKGIDQEAPASERQPTRMAVSAATDGAPGEAPEQLRRRVCVIGAGAAGLAAAKELLDEGHSVTVYEADSLVGGVWVISDEIEEDLTGEDRQALELGLGDMSRRLVHSSMYNGLRTNLPRELMTFDGFSFEDAGVSNIDNRRFCSHKAVMSYLAAYADQFSLMQHIHFRTRVISALPLEQEGSQKWIVTTVQSERAPKSGNVHSEEVFDAVVVGNGHYSSPRMPDLDGQRVYEGFQTHSHNYREPSQFMERRVVVLGAAASGEDISREIATCASKVFLCARSWQNPDWDPTKRIQTKADDVLVRKPGIVQLDRNDVMLEGGEVLEDIDCIVYCTGYHYRFPFLKDAGAVTVDDNRVAPLYEHLFTPRFGATLSFIGLPFKVVPFPMMQLQSRWVAQALSGRVILPLEEEMTNACQVRPLTFSSPGHDSSSNSSESQHRGRSSTTSLSGMACPCVTLTGWETTNFTTTT
eukprot:scaffold44_cov411-Prasinococcus_capsulatus_cf.AAC.6